MKKKKILITGASSGIGLAIAKRLQQQYTLVLHASKEENIKELREGNHILTADLNNGEELKAFCKKLKSEHGNDLFRVINNTGIALKKPYYKP